MFHLTQVCCQLLGKHIGDERRARSKGGDKAANTDQDKAAPGRRKSVDHGHGGNRKRQVAITRIPGVSQEALDRLRKQFEEDARKKVSDAAEHSDHIC